ncbi:hypothetical protein BD413DRAFT_155526 [Trametes elegans]|nr:hypothetical protein BD413DRAFT_155526 [Trametes elegans]
MQRAQASPPRPLVSPPARGKSSSIRTPSGALVPVFFSAFAVARRVTLLPVACAPSPGHHRSNPTPANAPLLPISGSPSAISPPRMPPRLPLLRPPSETPPTSPASSSLSPSSSVAASRPSCHPTPLRRGPPRCPLRESGRSIGRARSSAEPPFAVQFGLPTYLLIVSSHQ